MHCFNDEPVYLMSSNYWHYDRAIRKPFSAFLRNLLPKCVDYTLIVVICVVVARNTKHF